LAANVKKSSGSGVGKFFREIRSELRKVVWPNRKELVNYTLIVLIFSFVIALFIGVLDLGFSAGFQYLVK
jgi:preprotein translocase subunit SecE